jgi:hypothetical protein
LETEKNRCALGGWGDGIQPSAVRPRTREHRARRMGSAPRARRVAESAMVCGRQTTGNAADGGAVVPGSWHGAVFGLGRRCSRGATCGQAAAFHLWSSRRLPPSPAFAAADCIAGFCVRREAGHPANLSLPRKIIRSRQPEVFW